MYLHMFAPFHNAIDRGEHEKHLFLYLYGNTENPLVGRKSEHVGSHAHALHSGVARSGTNNASNSALSHS